MTLVHVLGGASLLILVAVSTVIRAGIGLDRGGAETAAADAVEETAADAVDTVEEPVAMLVTPHLGPLLDRMRP